MHVLRALAEPGGSPVMAPSGLSMELGPQPGENSAEADGH